jgi:uncharacterized surface protein with fasciclin (FAS1) repeats
MTMRKKIQIFVAAIMAVSFFACKTKEDTNVLQPLPIQLQGATKNAMEVIEGDPQFTKFAEAIKKYGLEAEFRRFPAKFTIFAPNNEAFNGVSFASDSAARNVLRYHIFQTESFRFSNQITSGPNETNAQLPNNLVWLNVPRVGEVYINGTPVVRADIPATNAVLHEIGKVLLPPTKTMYQIIAENPNLSRFRQAANTRPDLTDPDESFTAGAAALRQTLKSTRFQGTTSTAATVSSIFAGQNLTLFVPTDAAFDAVGVIDSLSVATLINGVPGQRIFNHHISTVSGRLFAKGLTPGALPTLAASRPVNILLTGGTVVVNRKSILGGVEQPGDPIGLAAGYNNATVTSADIIATNGVIHIINRVLQPEP